MLSVGTRDGMKGAGFGYGLRKNKDDSELEEGEARFYPESRHEDNFDPDVDLAYIDDKIQAMLGHFRKDFDGVASAETLGAVYGAYGSFLPSYQRSPSILSHPKTLQKVQNYSVPKSPNIVPAEVVHQNGTVPSNKRLGAMPTSAAALPVPGASLTSSKGDLYLSSSRGTTELNLKQINLNKSVNPISQNIPKVQIKVGPPSKSFQTSAAIYSGLGLDESPSSSSEASPAHSRGLSLEFQEAPYLSPTSILSIVEEMTSFPLPGGCLLSPLPENLLCLVEKSRNPSPLALEGSTEKCSSMLSEKRPLKRNEKGSGENKVTSLEKRSKEVNNGNAVNAGSGNNAPSKNEKSTEREQKPLELMTKHANTRFETWNSNNSSVDKVSEEIKASPSRDVQLDLKKDSETKGRNQRYNEFNPELNAEKDREFQNGGSIDPIRLKVVKEAFVAQEQDGLTKPNRKEQPPSGSIKKSKESQVNVAPTRELPKGRFSVGSSTVSEVKKTSVNNSSKVKPDSSKLRKESGTKREKNIDLLRGTGVAGKVNNSPDLFVRDGSKDSMADPMAASVACLAENVAPFNAVPAVAAPVVIKENWVCCDSCGTWRLLPFGTNADDLQQDQWLCSMLNWLPGMNRCDISEEETTKALYALYQLPVPESQNSLHSASTSGLCLADEKRLDQIHQGGSLPVMPNLGKKKLKEASSAKKQLHSFGDARHSKVDSKRRVDEDASRAAKKFKPERLSHANEDWDADNGRCSGKLRDRDSLSRGDAEMENYSRKDSSVKKRKVNEQWDSHIYPQGTHSSHANCLVDKASAKEISDSKFGKEKKAKVSNSELKETSISKGEQRTDKTGRVSRISRSPVPTGIEEQDVGYMQKDQDLAQYRRGNTASQQQFAGIDSSQRESIAATSSSSKVSGSRRSKRNFQEVRGSPVESVSSSPFRTSNVDNAITERRNAVGKTECSTGSGNSLPASGCADIFDQHDQHSGQGQGGEHAQGLGANKKHHHSNGSLQGKSRKDSSSQSRDKYRSSHSTHDKANAKVFGSLNEQEELPAAKNLGHGAENGSERFPPCHKEQGNVKYSFKGKVGQKSEKADKNLSGKEDSAGKWSSDSRRAHHSKSGQLEGSDGKLVSSSSHDRRNNLHRNLRQEPQTRGPQLVSGANKGCGSEVGPADNSSKVPKQLSHHSSTRQSTQSGQVARDLDANAVKNGPPSVQTADSAIKEGKDLKHKADRLKNSVSELEFITLYFQAALKFLHGASLLEPSSYDISRHGEMTRSMQLYGETANLCEFVALEYKKCKEMAAAALAYKCMEVAYMRVVYSKSACVNKDRLELQAALPLVPPGESPSSSASDIDNLNNQVTVDKVAPVRSVNTSQGAGNHLMHARYRPNIVRMLDHVHHVNSAMDAGINAHSAFAAACVGWEEVRDAKGISSVKRVVDFDYHDIEGLLRHIRLAMEAILR